MTKLCLSSGGITLWMDDIGRHKVIVEIFLALNRFLPFVTVYV